MDCIGLPGSGKDSDCLRDTADCDAGCRDSVKDIDEHADSGRDMDCCNGNSDTAGPCGDRSIIWEEPARVHA